MPSQSTPAKTRPLGPAMMVLHQLVGFILLLLVSVVAFGSGDGFLAALGVIFNLVILGWMLLSVLRFVIYLAAKKQRQQ